MLLQFQQRPTIKASTLFEFASASWNEDMALHEIIAHHCVSVGCDAHETARAVVLELFLVLMSQTRCVGARKRSL